jgi:hypothetical protein
MKALVGFLLVRAAVVVVTVGLVVQVLLQILPVLLIAGVVLAVVRITERRRPVRPGGPPPPRGWVWVPVWSTHLPPPSQPPIIKAEAVDDG